MKKSPPLRYIWDQPRLAALSATGAVWVLPPLASCLVAFFLAWTCLVEHLALVMSACLSPPHAKAPEPEPTRLTSKTPVLKRPMIPPERQADCSRMKEPKPCSHPCQVRSGR